MGPGSVLVDIRSSAGRIAEVRIAARRPALAPVFAGRSTQSVTALVPLMYAVCGRAQSAAANAAMAAARGNPPPTRWDDEVAAEAAGEQALAVLTGEASGLAAGARRAARDSQSLCALLDHGSLGIGLAGWLSLSSYAALSRWAQNTNAPLARECLRRSSLMEPAPHCGTPLPSLEADDGIKEWPLLTPEFAGMPNLKGGPAETGPVARLASLPLILDLRERPLLQHWIARLMELARYASGDPGLLCGRISAVAVAPGRGRAAVETARGTLLHEVALNGELVTDYVIVAPTEWNFHPEGALRSWLVGMQTGSHRQTLELARHAVQALDPCVECRYTVGH